MNPESAQDTPVKPGSTPNWYKIAGAVLLGVVLLGVVPGAIRGFGSGPSDQCLIAISTAEHLDSITKDVLLEVAPLGTMVGEAAKAGYAKDEAKLSSIADDMDRINGRLATLADEVDSSRSTFESAAKSCRG